MMDFFLKKIFEKYKDRLSDFFVRDLIGEIPKDVNDEAIRFLSAGKNKLDLWLRWVAYLIQRRLSQPTAKPDILQGELVMIKIISTIISKYGKSEVVVEQPQEPEISEDEFIKTMEGVENFKGRQKKDNQETAK